MKNMAKKFSEKKHFKAPFLLVIFLALIIANNPVKKAADEYRKKLELENKAKKDALMNEVSLGDRVFHPRFGIGKVYHIDKDTNEPTITVEFNKEGIREFDLITAGLKKF